MDIIGTYKVKPVPRNSVIAFDMMEEGLRRHHVKALVEIDVTKAREYIHNYRKRRGERLSFTGWIAKCISQAVTEHKQVQGYRLGRKKIVIFDDVDILIVVEREINGKKIPLPYIVRKANEKTFREIHDEIRSAQTQKVANEDLSLGQNNNTPSAKLYGLMPSFLRSRIWRKFRRDAFRAKKIQGTIGITAVGMFGKSSGWPITVGLHTLDFALGGIKKKPGVVDDKIEICEYLSMTVLIDHDIVDGAPAARFVSRLVELLESAFGLINS